MLTRSRSEAEDLVQRDLCSRIRGDRKTAHWQQREKLVIYHPAEHMAAISYGKSAPQLVAIDGEEGAMDIAQTGKDPHAFYVSSVEHGQVDEAIQQLPADFREIILLREFQDFVLSRDRRDLGCPTGTVMSRLARARATLRTLLAAAICTRDFAAKQAVE